jgi:hypothetical protein
LLALPGSQGRHLDFNRGRLFFSRRRLLFQGFGTFLHFKVLVVLFHDATHALYNLAPIVGILRIDNFLCEFLNINTNFDSQELKFVWLNIAQIRQVGERLSAELIREALNSDSALARRFIAELCGLCSGSRSVHIHTIIDFSVHIPKPFINLRHLKLELSSKVFNRLLAGSFSIELLVKLPEGHLLADRLAVLFIAFSLLLLGSLSLKDHGSFSHLSDFY